jgi:hypothetical protein
MFRFIRLIFSKPHLPTEPNLDILPETARKIVARRSHGNVRMQLGMSYNRDEVDARYAKLRPINRTSR